MRPHFRQDLQCSREEQQGVIFYRIDDPRSEANFRLYEIEFLIAQELNGEREMADIIGVVKQQHNFDISEPDLQRFVSQLESMGFLEGDTDASGENESFHKVETAPALSPVAASEDLLPDLDTGEASDADRNELQRLMRSALMHVKQGYLMHARDYFLAARELDPSNQKLTMVIGHLEIVGETPATAEMEYIWEQSAALAPEIASELGEFGSESTGEVSTPETLRVDSEEDIKSRVFWMLALLLVAVVGCGAIYWAVQASDIFSASKPVRVTVLESTRVPLYFSNSATEVRPFREREVGFKEGGRVASVAVEQGQLVQRDDLIGQLELPAKLEKKLLAIRRKAAKAQAAYQKSAERLSVIDAETQALQLKRDEAVEKLRELQPQQLLERGGVSKRDVQKWRRAKVQANRQLTQLVKKRRKPEAQERSSKKKSEMAKRKLFEFERRLGGEILRAAVAGRIAELNMKPGDAVEAKQPLVTIRDERRVILTFALQDAPTLQAGGQAYVSVSNATPTHAKVHQRKDEGENAVVQIELEDPTGAYLKTAPDDFRLVRDYAEPAFEVPASALNELDGEQRVFILLQNRAQAIPVRILEKNAAQAVIVNSSGSLRNGDRLVTAEVETGTVERLRDGSLLEPRTD